MLYVLLPRFLISIREVLHLMMVAEVVRHITLMGAHENDR
jgi:hypothetical protein